MPVTLARCSYYYSFSKSVAHGVLFESLVCHAIMLFSHQSVNDRVPSVGEIIQTKYYHEMLHDDITSK